MNEQLGSKKKPTPEASTILQRNERLFPISRATRFFPRFRRGRKVNRATVYRYSTIGLRGVILETVEAGARCTSVEAIKRFFDELTSRKSLSQPSPMIAHQNAKDAMQRLQRTAFRTR